MTEADIIRALFPALQVYHFAISMVGAFTVVIAIQHLGQVPLPNCDKMSMHLRRAALGALAVALFCSGVRMPALSECSPLALLSAAAVNTGVFLASIPVALPDWREILANLASKKERH